MVGSRQNTGFRRAGRFVVHTSESSFFSLTAFESVPRKHESHPHSIANRYSNDLFKGLELRSVRETKCVFSTTPSCFSSRSAFSFSCAFAFLAIPFSPSSTWPIIFPFSPNLVIASPAFCFYKRNELPVRAISLHAALDITFKVHFHSSRVLSQSGNSLVVFIFLFLSTSALANRCLYAWTCHEASNNNKWARHKREEWRESLHSLVSPRSSVR